MPELIRMIAPVVAGLSLAFAVYLVVGSIRFRPRVGRGLEDFVGTVWGSGIPAGGQAATSRGERIGSRIAERLTSTLVSEDETQ